MTAATGPAASSSTRSTSGSADAAGTAGTQETAPVETAPDQLPADPYAGWWYFPPVRPGGQHWHAPWPPDTDR